MKARKYDFLFILTAVVQLTIVSSDLKRAQRAAPRRYKLPYRRGCTIAVEDYPADPIVYLALSPLASINGSTITERQLEMNWNISVAQDGDWVGLFSEDPLTLGELSTSLALEYVSNIVDNPQLGHYRTSYQFGRPNFTAADLTASECLGYWIAYVRNASVLASSCFRSQPSWMVEDRDVIGDIPLRTLLFPGTHDSGSFKRYKGNASENIFVRYTVTHDENFFDQFVYGIRYLDIRIAYYPDQKHIWWLNHDTWRMNPFAPALQEIVHFLNSTNELLILDFHRFPVGFTSIDIHQNFINYLLDNIGDYMLPLSAGFDVTPNDMWNQNKRVLAAYADDSYVLSDLLWPMIPQEWANTDNLTELQLFLDGYSKTEMSYIWAGMAELTPSTFDIIFKPTGSLRILANRSNRNVTAWYRTLWWDTANVAAVDFFHSTDIVAVARDANKQMSGCRVRQNRRWRG